MFVFGILLLLNIPYFLRFKIFQISYIDFSYIQIDFSKNTQFNFFL